MGLTNARCDRQQGLMGRMSWQRLQQHYEKMWRSELSELPASVEVVYGHAWGSTQQAVKLDAAGEAVIPLASIRRQRNTLG